jgi:hypothetical protein
MTFLTFIDRSPHRSYIATTVTNIHLSASLDPGVLSA